MNSSIQSRVTSAHVLAVIAIVLALGGNALAFTLGRNSVGSKQLKQNAVTTAKIKKEAVTAAKIKKGTLTGAQINASTLGTVPEATNAANATNAQHAQTADAIQAPEALHPVGEPGEPPFTPAWGNIGVGHAGFYMDREGVSTFKERSKGITHRALSSSSHPPTGRPGVPSPLRRPAAEGWPPSSP
jgi:hypothetical protein